MADPVLRFPGEPAPAASRARTGLGARLRDKRRLILLVILPLIAMVAVLAVYLSGGRYMTTDNAYVGAQKVLITPDISGKIAKVVVREGQRVNVGDVLFEIDPEPFRLAVQQAQAKLAGVQTDHANLQTNDRALSRLIELAQKTAELKRQDVERKTTLIANRTGSQFDLDSSTATLVVAQTQVEQLTQQQAGLRNQLLGDPALPLEKFPPWMQAKAALDQAQRDLDHATVRAPLGGNATQVDNIQIGRYVTQGTPVFSIIDDTRPWVDANPKETDFTYVTIGQRADVVIDAFPDHTFRGQVTSLSPGTGSQFAILPPQNASGNWVKVVQRVPIRITFDSGEDTRKLRAGMSANVAVDTGRSRSLTGLLGLAAPAKDRGAVNGLLSQRANVPGLRRTIVTTCAMAASVMQTLDLTIANVALPFMQGSLSASLDQVNWVLTSYIVAAAIMTGPVGWLAARFGRKQLFVACVACFTFASVLCGLSQTLTQLVLFRLLQGACGAALIPLSQSLVIDLYPAHERPKAQSIFGMGIMLGPIMGPTLGAYLTDAFSWHWVFLVNVPFGLIATVGLLVFMEETPPNTKLRFDWFGFAALAIGIGALQLALDRGEQVGWFESGEIVAYAIVAVVGIYYFLAHSLTTPEPFIRFDLFKDRNYASACVFMVVMSVVLFSTMALVSPFLQNVSGHPILSAGLVLSSRGVGTFFAMMTIRSSMKYVEARTTLMCGLAIAAFTLYLMSHFTNDTTATKIFMVGTLQGFSFGMVFVSVNTVAFLTLPDHLRTYGASFQTLIRNIGSSFGISFVISQLTETSRRTRAELGDYVNPFNDALKMPDVASIINLSTDTGRALAEQMLGLQALIIAYAHDFWLLMMFAICALPVAFVIGPTKATFIQSIKRPPQNQPAPPAPEPAE